MPGRRIGNCSSPRPSLGESINGAVLFDETIFQQKNGGIPFIQVIMDAGIIPSIKVDTGARTWPVIRKKPTAGLDGLRNRLKEFGMGGKTPHSAWAAASAA